VSFASPLVLLGLLAIPALAVWYVAEQQRRVAAQRAFTSPTLALSPIPNRPRWRRHVPVAVLALALAVLILAAAKPQRPQTVPVTSATIMLANDVSDSMQSTDVKPSRLGAAQKAAETLIARVPSTVKVGSIEFARTPIVLQSPTADRRLTDAAVASLKPGGGGTAIGEAIETALQQIADAPKVDGKHPPGAIVLLSDGASNVGIDPVAAAALAKRQHVRIYTIAIGTPYGTIRGIEHGRETTIPVPVSPQQLADTAAASGGRTFRATDGAVARAIYAHLARTLGHKVVKEQITATFAGAGFVLLLLSGGLTLLWFARIA
jgi:Ca-activated chloride channel homolog